MRLLMSLIGLTALLMLGDASTAAEPQRLNVLFVAVDDLRPEAHCYGNPIIKTPNLDRLAARGTLFERAYCQQAVCSPTRSSLLTGRRPDTTKVYDLVTHFRKALPDVVTLPQHFKNNGYHTQGLSKIYHGGYDDEPSWSVPHWTPKMPGYGPESQALIKKLTDEAKAKGLDLTKRENQPRGPATEAPDVADNSLPDGATADRAIELLKEHKDKPFFLAVGFLKPHLPFVAPKKYWDLYKPEQIKLADNPYAPKDSPDYALTDFGELRSYYDMPKKGPVSDEQARRLIHGYYAAVSFMDAQLGRVLDELDRLKLTERTVIVLWGDHGWQLGEHGHWCKHTNYETSTRAALMMAAPGQKAPGKTTRALVEFVDIYPTLAELCGLPAPEGVEGTSFKPLLDAPDRSWKPAVFSQYPRGNIGGMGKGMGYSIRTDRYHLVEWTPAGKDFHEYELYDHQSDPKENTNLALKPEYAATVKELTKKLHDGWKAARPTVP